MFVAEHSEIGPDDLEKLFYNGFDNPESMELITKDDLKELAVSDIQIVLDKLRNVLQIYHSMAQPEQQN